MKQIIQIGIKIIKLLTSCRHNRSQVKILRKKLKNREKVKVVFTPNENAATKYYINVQ